MAVALSLPPPAAVQPASARASRTSRTTTISTAGSTRCSSTPTGNTAAPISKAPISRSTTPNSPRSGISPPSCCCKPGKTRARHRLRLGRPWALSRGSRRRRRHRHHAVAGAARRRQRARGGKGADRPRAVSSCRTIATSTGPSTASSRSACSSMSASITTTRSSARAAQLLADDGVMVLHSIGRSEGPNVTNPWIAKYIFPGGYIPSLSEVLPADRERRACWSPTSRSCACTTPRR